MLSTNNGSLSSSVGGPKTNVKWTKIKYNRVSSNDTLLLWRFNRFSNILVSIFYLYYKIPIKEVLFDMEKDRITEDVYKFICDAFHDVLLVGIKDVFVKWKLIQNLIEKSGPIFN